VPIIALTATATPEVQNDIIAALNMSKPAKFIKGFDRPNLSYLTINSADKTEIIIDKLRKTQVGSTIIYAGTRKRVEQFSDEIAKAGIKTYKYHAGLSEFARKQQQDGFFKDENAVVVATNAFGMGIDKPNVRNVIHVDYTSTLEAYYQEAGRAGRDGEPADCILIYDAQDYFLQDFFIKASYPERRDIIKVYNTIYDIAGATVGSVAGSSIFLSSAEIANKAGLSHISTASILKLLEKNKIIMIGSNKGYAKIKLNYRRNEIYEYYEHLPEIKKPVLEALLRSVSAEAFRKPVEADVPRILSKYNLSKESFQQAIREFQTHGVITYIPAKSATGLTLLTERLQTKDIPVDFEKIDARRELAYKKLDLVLRYASTTECKRNFILNYFGEDTNGSTCGRCTSCLHKTTAVVMSQREKFLIAQVVKSVALTGERFGKTMICDFLKGKRNKRINERRLYKLEGFASAKDMPETEISAGINNAILTGYIEQTADIYPVLKLTVKGRKKINTKPAKINYEQSQALLNINDLYQKFKLLRGRLAESRGIQPRGIISDRTMRAIAKVQPQERDSLLQIRGVSRAFVDNFGQMFLDIITDEINKMQETERKNETFANKPIYQKIKEYLIEGKSLQHIANVLKMTEADTARLIQEMLENGEIPQIEHLYNRKIYEIVKNFLAKHPYAALKEVKSELDIKLSLPLLRIIIAKARADLGITL
jgi:ATP-dependent DNA helicase RecQ